MHDMTCQKPVRLTRAMLDVLRNLWGLTMAPGSPLDALIRKGERPSAEDRQVAVRQLAADGWFSETGSMRCALEVMSEPDGTLFIGSLDAVPSVTAFSVGRGMAVFAVPSGDDALFAGPVLQLNELARLVGRRVQQLPNGQGTRIAWCPRESSAGGIVDFVGHDGGVAVQNVTTRSAVRKVPSEVARKIAEEMVGG